ncbi:MAG: hypothetical protein WCY78_00850 [Sphaerochaetaceae bacterium]
MQYVTVSGKDFEEAVRKARELYGSSLRIHHRRDVTRRGGFFWLAKRNSVELTCYLAPAPSVSEVPKEVEVEVVKEEEEAPVNQKELLLNHADHLLQLNDFSDKFVKAVLERLEDSLDEELSEDLSMQEFELMIVDKIVALIEIDHQTQLNPPRIFVLLGSTGVGKTTTIAKIAALYNHQDATEYRRSVAMITIDSFRSGAYEQLKGFANSLNIEVRRVSDEEGFYQALSELESYDLVLVDTFGKSPRDNDLAIKMRAMLSVPNSEETGFFLAVDGAFKSQDIVRSMEQFLAFKIEAMIITKLDETETVGNVLSVCYEKGMPLLFFTDGQRVPKDIQKASASTMLGRLNGFSLDFGNLWVNQSDSTD